MKNLLIAVLFFFVPSITQASDIYFGFTSAGSNNGTDCADAYAYNDGTHGINSSQTASWVAGNTLHLCGTWSGANGQVFVSTNGNGTSGSPITIRWETNAILQAPYVSSQGAIQINNTYIVVDGGTNGLLQNTLNGTTTGGFVATCPAGPCTQSQSSRPVYIHDSTCNPCGIEIKNLTIGPVYVHTRNSGDPGSLIDNVQGIYNCLGNETGVTVDHNVIHDAADGICTTGNNFIFAFNEVYNCAWGMGGGVQGITNVTHFWVHDNLFHDSDNWVDGGSFHINTGFHIFPSTSTQSVTDFEAYNNYLYNPATGANTAFMYMEGVFITPLVFNNVCVLTSVQWNQCLEAGTDTGQGASTNAIIANNTCVGQEYGPNSAVCMAVGGQSGSSGYTGLTYMNNVHILGGGTTAPLQVGLVEFNGVTITDVNNNLYENILAVGDSQGFSYNGSSASTLSTWQVLLVGVTGADSAAVYNTLTNLKVSLTTGIPSSGSPAITAGANLTSLGITALDCDAPRVVGPTGTGACNARPSSSAWDIGAYQQGGGVVLPPSSLTVFVTP